MATLEINGKRVQVDDAFKSLSPEEQEATVQQIAQQMGMKPDGGPSGATEFLGQAARSIGGAVDLLTAPGQALGNAINDRVYTEPGHNTPDRQKVQPTERAATEALVRAGIASPEGPQNVTGAAGAGFGDALVAFAPVVKALQAAKAAGGVTGALADDMYAALATRLGMATETAAGAVSRGAQQGVKEAGGSEAMQTAAGLLAPLSVPMAASGLRRAAGGTYHASQKLPLVGYADRIGKDVVRMFAPMSEPGARQVASRRVQDLVGAKRREELARSIDVTDEFGRTPAEQTGDPNLMGLQESAAAADPVLRERLAARREGSVGAIVDAVRAGSGEIRDTRTFFRKRLSQFKTAIGERIEEIIAAGDDVLRQSESQGGSPSELSTRMVDKLNDALADARTEERALWGAIPETITFDMAPVKAMAQEIIDRTPTARQHRIPQLIRDVAGNRYGPEETFGEVQGIRSELLELVREGSAGNERAPVGASRVAEVIRKQFDEIDTSELPEGKTIAEARAFTKALNEKFFDGAPGRLLAQTKRAAPRVTPEAALDATVRAGRSQGAANTAAITNAAPEASQEVSDYLRDGFMEAALDASGKYTPRTAMQWVRKNAETLKQFPEMEAELKTALQSRNAVQAYALKLEARAKMAEGGPVSGVADGKKAVDQIIGAENPLQAAKSITNAARKDPSGKALAGVKGAFSDYLTADPTRLPALMADPKVAGALTRIYDPAEMKRLKTLSRYMGDLNVDPNNVGEVLNTPATAVVEYVVRFLAVRHANKVARDLGAGGTVQIPGMASNAAKKWLGGMTNDKARQILMDAIEDPDLMRALLTDAPGPELPPRVRNKLAPYLTGAVAAEEE